MGYPDNKAAHANRPRHYGSYMRKINFALLAFVAFSIRMVALGASFSDAVVMLVLAAMYAYDRWLHFHPMRNSDKAWTEKIERELADVRSAVAAVKLGAVAVGQGLRKLGGNGP